MTTLARPLTLRGQINWRWTSLAHWLEELPPFWVAYAMTLTETVGASILALPIALAGVGPIAGVILLIVLGLVNLVTVMGITEAITRNGNMRYGANYFGRLVGDYLGKPGTVILTVSLWFMLVLSMIICYIGVATTLAAATPLPATLWAALLFGVGCYFLGRKSLNATLASALVIGAINIGIILLLALLALPHVRLANLLYVNLPFGNGLPLNRSMGALVFGVVLGSYFGHTSAANAAKTVLRRDPTGNTLLWGNVAAMLTAMVIYVIWVVAVNGSVAPAVLLNTRGTALTALATVVGPVVFVPGTIFVMLGMGMLTIHFSLTLFNQTREWLAVCLSSDESAPSPGLAHKIRQRLAGRSAQFWVGMTPVVLIFLWVEGLLLTGRESFIAPMAFTGTLTAPVLGGIFPLLILVASRRKGEVVPGIVWRWLGHPLIVGGVYLIFLASLLVHGLFIWSAPLPRLGALLMVLVVLGLPVMLIRQRAFATRTVVELRIHTQHPPSACFAITSAGHALVTDVSLDYQAGDQQLRAATGEVSRLSALRCMTIQLPPLPAQELKIWVHQITAEDISIPLLATVLIDQGSVQQTFDLTTVGTQVIVPMQGQACRVEIRPL